ncbi:hypothetical protein FRC09_007179 [Ceratobasidium sp. 395]|nr:hypothetical protein FRC09_007179 [Ceratobasidium sp. 395]
MSGSHNKYEGDASATRADAYLNNGDASSLNLTFFKQLYDLQPEGSPNANFNYDVIIKHREARRQHSVSTNPHFFNGPFSGFIALPAAYSTKSAGAQRGFRALTRRRAQYSIPPLSEHVRELGITS